MFNAGKTTLKLLFLVILPFLLAVPVSAESHGGRLLGAELSGVITIEQEDGSTHTIDYGGTLRAGLHRDQIVIDIIHAGVIRETGERVTITNISAGTFQRRGNQFQFNTAGLFALELEDGGLTLIDITGAGIIRQNGRNIVIDIMHAGVVQASEENVRIHTVGGGEMHYSGEIADGTDI